MWDLFLTAYRYQYWPQERSWSFKTPRPLVVTWVTDANPDHCYSMTTDPNRHTDMVLIGCKEEDRLSVFQLFLVSDSSSCIVKASRTPLSSLTCLLVSPFFSSYLGNHVGETLWVVAFNIIRRENLTENSLFSG